MAQGLEAAAGEAEIPDRRLALMFACAHPAIDPAIRAPLMLQVSIGIRCRNDRFSFLDCAGDDGPATGARKKQNSTGWDSVSRS